MNTQTFRSNTVKSMKDVLMIKYDPKIDTKVVGKNWKI